MTGFFLQLAFGIVPFVYSVPRRRFFVLRLLVALAAVYGIQVLYDMLTTLFFEDRPDILYLFGFVLMLADFIIALWFVFDVNIKRAMLYGMGGYAAQNAAYYLRRILFTYIGGYLPEQEWVRYVIEVAVYLVVYVILLFVVRYARKAELDVDIRGGLVIVISLVTVVVSIVMSAYLPGGRKYILSYIYVIIVDIALIVLQLGIFRIVTQKREVQVYEQLLEAERRQHEIAQTTIETINLKCHDIKHQIAVILASDKNESYGRSIKEIQDCISVYDSIADTGNETLDIILTEKGLLCERNKIHFSYLADGRCLAFMDVADICCLFGNALDNAIESASQESDLEKRFISLNVSSQNHLINIHMENYCGHDLIFKDGLPVTTKESGWDHGFGMRSIRLIAKKYGGNMVVHLESHLFCLDIMIPV